MAQIIYCSNQIREETRLLPLIEPKETDLIKKTFNNIYHLSEGRTIENQLSVYIGEKGKEKIYLKDIINRMESILQWAGNDSTITVWNEIVELTPYNYMDDNGNRCVIQIYDDYIKTIYNSGEKRFQVASNVRFNNITNNALLILTICTRSYTDGTPLDISGTNMGKKARDLQTIIKKHTNKRKPKCLMRHSTNQYEYNRYQIEDKKSAIIFE